MIKALCNTKESRTSFRCIIKELRLKPYRSRSLCALSDSDPDRRCEFADIYLNLIADDSSLPPWIIWTNDTTCKLKGHTNRVNLRLLSCEKSSYRFHAKNKCSRRYCTGWDLIMKYHRSIFFLDIFTARSYLKMFNRGNLPCAPVTYARNRSVKNFTCDTFLDSLLFVSFEISKKKT